jgi:aryl-alcohol dehydrogenase-like predicted oxidoreductase
MKMKRREFMAATLAATAGLASHCTIWATKRGNLALDDPFQPVPLGKTGLRPTLIGYGTGMRGGMRASNQTRLGKERFEALLRYTYEKGVRYYDCADLYGTHPYIADAFKSMPRENLIITTKIWTRPGGIPEPERPEAAVVVDRFRKELNTDYIDLVSIHCMTDGQWTDQQKRTMDGLADCKAKKVIRAHGVSVHSLAALKACVDSPWVDSVHVRINAYGDAMDDKDPAVVADVVRRLHAAGKGVIGMKLVGEGRYRNDPDKRDKSIQFVLGLGSVDTVIVGFEKTEEVDDFAMRTRQALILRKEQDRG